MSILIPRPRTRARRGQDQRGSGSMEAVIVFPVLLLLVFGALQMGLYAHARSIALASAQEGARVAAAEHGTQQAGDAAAATFAVRVGSGVLERASPVTVRTPTTVTTTVTGTAISLIPLIDLHVSQHASLPVERIS